jgi:Family of unknown function (DUF6496)
MKVPVRQAAFRPVLRKNRSDADIERRRFRFILTYCNDEETTMPDRKTLERAQEDRREGKAPSTQAGEFVREEFEHIREGKHGARSPKQAIAIGLSKARRAGVELAPPKKGTTSESTRKSAERALKDGRKTKGKKSVSRRRSRSVSAALKREPRSSASSSAISRQAKSAAKRRSASSRSAAARRAARTKGQAGRSAAARKAARTRNRRRG